MKSRRARDPLEYRDGAGTVLATYDSGEIANPGAWLPVTDRRAAPVGTRSALLRLQELTFDARGRRPACFYA